eukprot:m.43305 g.43305  ORF g.43305 m.43305 type:complete len:494 (+) comp9965_c0_seq1:348-1829(+)
MDPYEDDSDVALLSPEWQAPTPVNIRKQYQPLGVLSSQDGGQNAPAKLLSPHQKQEREREYGRIHLAFAVIGMAMSMTWGSISFPLRLWTFHYPHIWPIFNIMYNAPGFPILFALIASDSYVEKKIGLLVAYRFRLLSCFIGLLIFTIGTGFIYGQSRLVLILWVACIGILVGCLHAWIFSFASHVAPNSYSYLLLGGGASTGFLVVINQIFHIYRDADPSRPHLVSYFGICTVPVFLGMSAALYLLYSPLIKARLEHHDLLAIKNPEFEVQPLNSIYEEEDETVTDYYINEELGLEDEHDLALSGLEDKMNWKQIVHRTWPCLVTICVISFSIIGITGLIPIVPSQYKDDSPQAANFCTFIMYSTSFGIVVGSELAVLLGKCLKKQGALLAWEMCRILMLPFAITYAVERFFLNDAFFIVFMGAYFTLGLFGMSKAFNLAQSLTNQKSCSLTVNICNVALYIGTYMGLTLPYWVIPLIKLIYPNRTSLDRFG